MLTNKKLIEAFETRDLAKFIDIFFPQDWAPIGARIIESGATISHEMCPWAPRWSPVPPTLRVGADEIETALKSCIFRAHDCIHQLWGLPMPGPGLTKDDFYVYKRAQMCGEVSVLALTEFLLVSKLADKNTWLGSLLSKRKALAMLNGPLLGRNILQIAARLDELLHKKIRPKWVRDHAESLAFVEDYVPMLEFDRRAIDHNWELMKAKNWRLPDSTPNARYNPMLTGLELTTWMITDFEHLLDTDPKIDTALAEFNRERRSKILLPDGWNEP